MRSRLSIYHCALGENYGPYFNHAHQQWNDRMTNVNEQTATKSNLQVSCKHQHQTPSANYTKKIKINEVTFQIFKLTPPFISVLSVSYSVRPSSTYSLPSRCLVQCTSRPTMKQFGNSRFTNLAAANYY